jgi:hypothetical protein
MLKKLVWNLLATATGMNFKSEYEKIVKLGSQIFACIHVVVGERV